MKMELISSVSYLEKERRESHTSRIDLGDGRLSKFDDTVDWCDHYGKEYRKLEEKNQRKKIHEIQVAQNVQIFTLYPRRQKIR